MTIRDILTLPEPILRRESEPVETVDDSIRALADDMLATMYAAPGIGLAAIQIGEPKRLLVMDVVREDAPRDPVVMINPEIVWAATEMSFYNEGCLSIPDYTEEIARPARVGVRFLDREGGMREITADGLLATCVQHEIDHLNGVLFIDHLSKLKRQLIERKFAKQARLAARARVSA